MKTYWLSTAYGGSLDYWAVVAQGESLVLEACENFSKQSYRNRCYIDAPNGRLMLNVPVQHGGRQQIDQIQISYQEAWPLKHWQALQTSYGQSPFFEAIAADIKSILDKKYALLWQLNQAMFRQIAAWLQLELDYHYSDQWLSPVEITEARDLRNQIHPKQSSVVSYFPPYPQVFDHKHGFQANLSVLDLIFQEGPAAYDYLKDLEFVISSPDTRP